MKTVKCTLVSVALIFSTFIWQGQGADGPPPLPKAAYLLSNFKFDSDLLSTAGLPPKTNYGVELVPSFASNAVRLAGSGPALLQYNYAETNQQNFNCQEGSIWMWFHPLWESSAPPTNALSLIELGAYSPQGTNG
jgi:hypothetical protein